MRIKVRRAVVDDAEAIAGIHVTAWRETYAHLVSAEKLAALNPDDRVERWREIITGPEETAWIAELDGVPVGWATTSSRDAAVEPRGLELNGIYALATVHGSGVGQALLDRAIGIGGAYLWAASDNPRAQAFYRRNGFSPDGESRDYELLATSVPIVRWVR
ncbi:MAG: family N-acetyltransferase [Rhodoglobus sp.]|nr:family N-acetyltransferase [Rhodoglobus sp.]